MLPPMVANYEMELTQFEFCSWRVLGCMSIHTTASQLLCLLVPLSLLLILLPPSSFLFLPTLSASIFETPWGPRSYRKTVGLNMCDVRKKSSPLHAGAGLALHSLVMLFYQTRTQNAELRRGYSEIMIKMRQSMATSKHR